MGCKELFSSSFTTLTGVSLTGSDGFIVSWTISANVSQGVSSMLSTNYR